MALTSKEKLVVVKAFAPANPLPLDAREIYESLAEARSYAATSPIAYAGQTIKVVENGVVTTYNLAPSEEENVNFTLQFVGGGGEGIQGVGTSATPGNISVTTVEGDTAVVKDVPVVGAFVDATVTADSETESEKTEFTYRDANNAEQKKVIYATGARKVEAGSVADKIKVTNADATGALTTTEILIGAGSVKNPTYDAENRKITLPILQADGTTQALEIALGKDMVVTSGAYNEETHEIELTLTDGSVIKIPAAELVDIYTGGATATVTIAVSSDNKITAAVKISTAEGNLLKSDENGLYVVEADFVATKQLITDGVAAAKAHADSKVAAEATARDTAIEAALTEAKEYTDTEKASAIATANGYTDTKVGNEATAREAAITAAKDEVKGYTDTEVSTALAEAKEYIDEKVGAENETSTAAIEAALTEAKEYADTQIGTAKTEVKGYTDTQVAAETSAREAADAALKTEVNGYTDDQISAAKTAVNGYTDEKVGAEVTAREAAVAGALTEAKEYTDTQIGTAKTEVKGYTDTQVEAEKTAREAAEAALKTEVKEYADTQAGNALTEAKAYTDEKVAAEVTARDEAIDDAIAAEVTARDNAITNAVSAETTAREQADAALKTEVNGYTDTQVEAAKTAANGYTDTKVEAEATARGTAIEAALTEAKGYTDTQVSAEVTARDNAITAAKTEVKGYTDTEVGSCLTAAKAYTDNAIEAIKVQWVDFGA